MRCLCCVGSHFCGFGFYVDLSGSFWVYLGVITRVCLVKACFWLIWCVGILSDQCVNSFRFFFAEKGGKVDEF